MVFMGVGFAARAGAQEPPGAALVQSLGAEQISILQSLSPAEQSALAEKAGISLAAEPNSKNPIDQNSSQTVAAPERSSQAELRSFFPGATPLPLFGYELFDGVPTTFAPVENIPVPANYALGPGDLLEVQLLGDRGGRYRLTVNRNGDIDFPQIGPVTVAGMRFSEVKTYLEERVATQMPGMRVSVTLGQLRSMQIFVLGETSRPGSFTVSSLSTISNALMASGGVKSLGSLRNIELRRGGRLVGKLDLYDFLVRGDTSDDQRLMPGDVVFVPPIGPTVGISGSVKRPAIYELSGKTALQDLIGIAGGLAVDADVSLVTINRVSPSRGRTISNLNLDEVADLSLPLNDGDYIAVSQILPGVVGQVELAGHVHRPGKRALQPGMRVTDLVPSPLELKPFPDIAYALIVSLDRQTAELSTRSVNLREAWKSRGSAADLALSPNDQVLIFERNKPRDELLDPVLSGLRAQATAEVSHRLVKVSGAVKIPGEYPYEPSMTVRDMVRAAGGLSQEAYTVQAELLRYRLSGEQVRQREILAVDIRQELQRTDGQSTEIAPFDELLVKVIPEWSDGRTVELAGEVRFPGVYPIVPGETLGAVIARAGGLTVTAHAEAAFFSRKALREKDLAQLQRLQDDLRRGLAASEGDLAKSSESSDIDKLRQLRPLLEQEVKDNPALGRLSIDLSAIIVAGAGSQQDIPLIPGDRLFIPQNTPEVSVYGEVFFQTAVVWTASATAEDYVRLAGGYRTSADVKNVYVIRASGYAAPVNGWRRGRYQFKPGDSIIVPYKFPRLRNPVLEVLAQSSQVIYNLALGAAALRAVNP